MSKKVMFTILMAIVLGCVVLTLHPPLIGAIQNTSYPCNINGKFFGVTVCQGYFTQQDGSNKLGPFYANLCNALQLQPNSSPNCYPVGPPPPDPKQCYTFMCVDSASKFTSRVNQYLYSSYLPDQIGAAFIIETMLNHTSPNVPVGQGISIAKADYNAWQSLVNFYASSPDPSNYGVNWNYSESESDFCTTSTLNSAYLSSIGDDVFHSTIVGPGCHDNWLYFGSRQIEFYWNGTKSKFMMGAGCGNVDLVANPIPQLPPPGSGSISLNCIGAPTDDHWAADITFKNYPSAEVTVNGWTSPPVNKSPNQIDIPQSVTDPYGTNTVTLLVEIAPGMYAPDGSAISGNLCVTFICGSLIVTPDPVDPNMHFNATVTVNNDVGKLPPPPGAKDMMLQISPTSGVGYSYTGTQPDDQGSGGQSLAIFTGLGPTYSPGSYNAKWSLLYPDPNMPTCQQTFNVVDLPYLSIYGGDTMIGASPSYEAGVSTCASDSYAQKAGIFSWNNHNPGDYSGAGVQYAAEVLNKIEDFATAQHSSGSPPPPPIPTGLSLANNNVDPGNGLFGGFFAATTGDCDFTSDLTVQPSNPGIIAGHTIMDGHQEVTYVKDHDVYIQGNIVYQDRDTGWSSASQIPYFKLVVVGGNIYIGNNVTQLDGIYVSEPDTASNPPLGGTLYTCSYYSNNAPHNYDLNNSRDLSYYFNDCHNQLVINGAFVAAQVQFLRTIGTISQASSDKSPTHNNSAEVFNYTPEIWLPRGSNVPNTAYDAIAGLPPVL